MLVDVLLSIVILVLRRVDVKGCGGEVPTGALEGAATRNVKTKVVEAPAGIAPPRTKQTEAYKDLAIPLRHHAQEYD